MYEYGNNGGYPMTGFSISMDSAPKQSQSENLSTLKSTAEQRLKIFMQDVTGVSAYALKHAEAVSIPQPGGQESLNVAVAGSICFFEMVRQRL